jgi:hypothetical protein
VADPFRLRVLKAVTAAIKAGVTPDLCEGEITFDLRDTATEKHVFRGRTDYGYNDVLPIVSVLEDPRAQPLQHGVDAGGQVAGDWQIIVQGFVQDDPENPTDPAQFLVAEVIRALIAERKRNNVLGLGYREPCVMDMKVGSPVVRPADISDEGISDTAHFVFTLTLSLSEDLEKPFA